MNLNYNFIDPVIQSRSTECQIQANQNLLAGADSTDVKVIRLQ